MLFKTLAAAALLAVSSVHAAKNALTQMSGISPNPTGLEFFLYKPAKLASPTPLIVAIHYCTGSAQAYFQNTQYATLADTYGYMVIYPNALQSNGLCFDVSTNATLTHNGGSDSEGIAGAVQYAISNLGVSPGHVFVTGSSSGAMMTNVMAATYPNLFAAASVYSGVAAGCFAVPSSATYAWNNACANGDVNKTAAQWGSIVKAAYPGYTGSYPRMMLLHGTVDTTLYYENLSQEILEWTDVFGVSSTAQTTTNGNPSSAYTKWTYGSNVLAYSGAGVGHTVPVMETLDLAWFGIAGTSPAGPAAPGSGSGTTTTNPTTTTSTTIPIQTSTTPVASGGCSTAKYGQCGGIGFTGCTTCASGSTCKESNAYYSQCL